MKKILGLDLGTTSIGWALVNESEKDSESSGIIKTGVRVIPVSTEESNDFKKGKSISLNADRTLKRSARRNLQRYKLRREQLVKILSEYKIIDEDQPLAEVGKDSTFQLWELRSKAASEHISLHELSRVLLSINKKRGYKSSRKAKDESEGEAIDAFGLAKELYENNLTPGQYVLRLLKEGKRFIPDFYRSDLKREFQLIWDTQKTFYPDILTSELSDSLEGKNKKQTWAICQKPFGIVGIKRKTKKGINQKIEDYSWRVDGLTKKIGLEELAIVFQEINGQISNSSGYLGEIGDRSKKLYLKKQTIGQYLYNSLVNNPHSRLKNQVFYRQDYLDEFERIWEIQSKGRESILTEDLKKEIRDVIIFYQRRLKSQKGLISICELEGHYVQIEQEGKTKLKLIGPRVIPKSSPLFQEFKIWQILNNVKFKNTTTQEVFTLRDRDEDAELRKELFIELSVKSKLTSAQLLKHVVDKPKNWEVANYENIEGNSTFAKIYEAIELLGKISGHEIDFSNMSGKAIKEAGVQLLENIGVDAGILDFNASLQCDLLEQQPSYQFWHLLYSFEGDNSKSGIEKLKKALEAKFNFAPEYAAVVAKITFPNDYGSLSAKAIRKILPEMKEGKEYSEASSIAGYRHSHHVTKEENENRQLKDFLEVIPKNSLRNPIVEKILNQMVNVVNSIISEYGRPDEIRVELARELKNSAKERAKITSNITQSTKLYDSYRKKLESIPPFNQGVRITKNDLIKYRLYLELNKIGFKTLYTGTKVPREKLFTKEFDVEHIIPKAVLFDDSFSNKTLSTREFNRWKSNKTALDAVIEKYGEDSEGVREYQSRIDRLFDSGKGVISSAKRNKLLMHQKDISDGFIERDLRNSQYIAKKAMQMLLTVCRSVTPTTGKITDRLREDWQLINVLKELNWSKYHKLGLTDYETSKDGRKISVIKDWTKRNDHRHHAMDALTVAFTKRSHVQYFNYLNARKDEDHSQHKNIVAIQDKETYVNEKGKRLVKPPMPIVEFRKSAKEHLEGVLVSNKAKNKVVTKNKNRVKTKKGVINQSTLTPRGFLHKETVYGSSWRYHTKIEKVGPKFTEEVINTVAKKKHREALLTRLKEFDGNPKKAFGGANSIAKKPIFLDEYKDDKVPEKVKLVWKEKQFTIRKAIDPDLKTEKVLDKKIKTLLEERLKEFGGDAKKAFSNIENNPIWLQKPVPKEQWKDPSSPKPNELGISIKRVTITGVSKAYSLHNKRDVNGKEIKDEEGQAIPNDFVSTGNNHHVAIYEDEKGNLQERIVSFFEAVTRVNQELPIIQKVIPEFPEWKFLFTLKQNEYFVFPNPETGFVPEEVDLLDEKNAAFISPNLYRVQKIATKNYWFRHHLETNVETPKQLKDISYKIIQSETRLQGVVKVRLNRLGKIVAVGE